MTTSVDPRVRKFVVRAIRKGLITVSEGARFACVSPQAVHKWVGPGSERWRALHVARIIQKMLDTGDRVLSKSEQRIEAEEAKEQWEWRNGTAS